MQTNQHRREDGFTLIEIMVAMVVSVIGLAGLLAMYTSTMNGFRGLGETREARTLAEATLEEYRATTIADLETQHGPVPIDVTLPPSQGRSGQAYLRRLEVQTVTPEIVRVRIQIDWTERGATQGAANGEYDHTLDIEVLRDRNEKP